MVTYYIGADVHARTTELAFETKGKIVKRLTVPTTVPALREALTSVGGTRIAVMEEGPLADWLWRNLRQDVDELGVCDPRRNHLVSDDGDKDDSIDCAKLAALRRGKFLRMVHHPVTDVRAEFKRWVSLYYDRTKQATREINKIRMLGYQCGLKVPGRVLKNKTARKQWLAEIPSAEARKQLGLRLNGYDAVRRQKVAAQRQLGRLAAREPVIAAWCKVPGIGLIRAVTLLVYLDTPWRFKKPTQLCKYCGIGLERTASGTDRQGRPRPGQVKMPWRANRRLKDVVLGAAMSAIHQPGTPFAELYEQLIGRGMAPGNAWHTMARKMLKMLCAMWKTGSPYQANLVVQSR